MIRSFGDRATEDLFHGKNSRQARRIASDIRVVALRKLDLINAAISLRDLRAPPGNRLEALSGALQGMHSIRINAQWRVIFRWTVAGAEEVRIVDYHR